MLINDIIKKYIETQEECTVIEERIRDYRNKNAKLIHEALLKHRKAGIESIPELKDYGDLLRRNVVVINKQKDLASRIIRIIGEKVYAYKDKYVVHFCDQEYGSVLEIREGYK